jgi:hypothetical protein
MDISFVEEITIFLLPTCREYELFHAQLSVVLNCSSTLCIVCYPHPLLTPGLLLIIHILCMLAIGNGDFLHKITQGVGVNVPAVNRYLNLLSFEEIKFIGVA